MASTSLQVAGLASNFDWKGFVDQVMNLEHAPADRLAAERSANSQKVTQLGSLGSKLTALQDVAHGLKAASFFGKRTATSSTADSSWNIAAATSTVTGSHAIAVSQLATTARLDGAGDIGAALNTSGDDVSGLTLANLPLGQAVTAGTFSVNGQKVTIALTDSLQDVFDAIANATGGNVTARYDHTTDRVTLASTSGNVVLGAANDTSNFLRALKLGNNGTDTVSSSAALGTVKKSATLANANLGATITAVDGAGAGSFSVNGVDIAYNVNTDTLTTVLKRINDSSAGVTASYDSNSDRVVLTNKSTGDLGIAVNEAAGGLLGALGLSNGTTLVRGDNAEFTIDGGSTLTSASNTLDATVHGVTGLSVTVDTATTQTITIAADAGAMRTQIESFVSKFNEVQQFLDSVTKVSTDSKGKVTAAVLANNREIQDWGRSLRSLAFAAVSGLSGSISRLNDLGLDFKAGTNELEIDDSEKLDRVLKESTPGVEEFFTTATTGFAAKLDAFVENVTEQNSDQQERLNKTNSSLDDQIAAIERRLEQQRALLESAFIQMENAQSQLKQQQSALDGMMAQSKN